MDHGSHFRKSVVLELHLRKSGEFSFCFFSKISFIRVKEKGWAGTCTKKGHLVQKHLLARLVAGLLKPYL